MAVNSSRPIPPPGPAAEDIASVVVQGNLIPEEEPYPPVVRVVSECGSEASALARVVCDLQVVLCKVLVYSFSWEKPSEGPYPSEVLANLVGEISGSLIPGACSTVHLYVRRRARERTGINRRSATKAVLLKSGHFCHNDSRPMV